MSFNQLGQINFTDLARYIWRSSQDFGAFQTYLQNQLTELITSRQEAGVIYGGQVTVVSGLTVQVAKSLVLFSNGKLVAFDTQQVTLNAADATNPRIDRIEVAYSLVDGVTVANIDLQSKVFDKLYTGTVSKNTGTAAGSPSAPVKTAGNLSLALVTVAANQTILASTDISQVEQGLDRARPLLSPQESATIANNQAAAANLGNLGFDSSKTRSARVRFHVYRSDSLSEVVRVGYLMAYYKPTANSWTLIVESDGDDLIDSTTGFEFSITATGRVQYKSGNMPGTGYTGQIYYKVESIS